MKTQLFSVLIGIAVLGASAEVNGVKPSKKGGTLRQEYIVTQSPEALYQLGSDAFIAEKWDVAVKYYQILTKNFSSSSYGQDAFFFLGVAYYNLNEFDTANKAFDSYLQCQSNPRYFQEAFEYKYSLAEQFRSGARRRLLGTEPLPKLVLGKDIALDVYDEVIASMPGDEIAAKSLFGKACILWQQKDFREAVESFEAVIQRFPKNERAPESYLLINKVYLNQCQHEYQNPDILAFAEINTRKFEEHFPNEERLDQARKDVLAIKEVCGKGLFDMGQFYEKVRQPRAAVIYYRKAMIDFPETQMAERSRRRLAKIAPHVLEFDIPVENEEADVEDIEFIG